MAQLPTITTTHPHYKEWQIRSESSQVLIDYLQRKKQPTDILEIGCGNGWLSHRLSAIPSVKVIGTDINFTEIQQAARIFQNISNLHFIYVHIEPGVFKDKKFDIIVFAASMQYFESLTEVINNTLRLLKPNGEIHIIDSAFYSLSELGAAKQRSRLYYQEAGFPEMANCYFHHSLDDLDNYNYKILYDPKSLLKKLLRNKNPFPWICIQQKDI